MSLKRIPGLGKSGMVRMACSISAVVIGFWFMSDSVGRCYFCTASSLSIIFRSLVKAKF